MRRKPSKPDKRWCLVQEALNEEGPHVFTDPIVERVYNVIKKESADPVVWAVVDLIEDNHYKDCVIAFFLSMAEHQTISDVMWIPLEVIQLFGKLIIDFEQFKHKMDYRFFAERYAESVKSPRIRSLMRMAISDGPNSQSFYWANPGEQFELKPKELSSRLATMSYFKAISAKNEKINSEESKEALKWASMTRVQLQAYNDFEEKNVEELGAYDAVVAFEQTKTAEQAGLTSVADILH